MGEGSDPLPILGTIREALYPVREPLVLVGQFGIDRSQLRIGGVTRMIQKLGGGNPVLQLSVMIASQQRRR